MDNYSIIAKDLVVEYDRNRVLDKLNFQIVKGEFIGLIGRSGSGKTTLLNTMASFLPYNGSLTVNGSVGFCFQNNSLFYWMTVEENISFGITGKDKKQKVHNLLNRIGLYNLRHKFPNELSGGQIQRVALARAIAAKPDILFLDEPFSSLDIFTRDLMIEWVLDFIAETNLTVVMVTHYIDEALIFSDRIFTLQNKQISNEITITFPKPRNQEIRFSENFQLKKQHIFSILNQL